MLKLAPGVFANQGRQASEKTKRELAQFTQRMIARVLEREVKPGDLLLKTSAKA
jgi:hypothetical protein